MPPLICGGLILWFARDWDRHAVRFPTSAASLEMRVRTKERRFGVELADDLPNYSGHSGRLMLPPQR
jgi:hypothetical protein